MFERRSIFKKLGGKGPKRTPNNPRTNLEQSRGKFGPFGKEWTKVDSTGHFEFLDLGVGWEFLVLFLAILVFCKGLFKSGMLFLSVSGIKRKTV